MKDDPVITKFVTNSISDIYSEKYPKLTNELAEIKILEVNQLIERFNANPKYITETFEYSMKDNEIIFSMAQESMKNEEKSNNLINGIGYIIIAIILVYAVNKWMP